MAQELKAFDVGLGQYCEDGSPCVVAFDTDRNPRLLNEKVYLKSEADKVIAELKKERDWLAKDRAQAYDDLGKRAQLNIKQEESIRHQKYKRCLAMAAYCHTNVHCIMGHRLCALADWKKDWFKRWHRRWLELAEKFKEGV